jgi:hypothetical protein
LYLLAAFAVAACVGDSTVGPNDGGGDVTTGDTGVDSPPSDSGADVPCATPNTVCTGQCVNTATSAQNCGTCGHDCGAGQCSDGVCQPFAVRDGLDGPVHMSVNANGVFFTQEPDPLFQILKCPLSGCTQTPTVTGAAINYIESLEAGPGTIIFVTSNQTTKWRPTLFYCSDAGCPGSILTQQVDSDGLGSLTVLTYETTHAYWFHQNNHALRHSECSAGTCTAVESTYVYTANTTKLITTDATSVYTVDSVGNELWRCPAIGANCSPTNLAPTVTAVAIAQANATLYLLYSGASGYQNGNIKSCSSSTCNNGTPASLIPNLAYPLLLAQDGTTAFWYADDTGVIQSAALQNPGTPAAIVKNLAGKGVTNLKTYGSFVYWVQLSPTSDAGKYAIMAIAK